MNLNRNKIYELVQEMNLNHFKYQSDEKTFNTPEHWQDHSEELLNNIMSKGLNTYYIDDCDGSGATSVGLCLNKYKVPGKYLFYFLVATEEGGHLDHFIGGILNDKEDDILIFDNRLITFTKKGISWYWSLPENKRTQTLKDIDTLDMIRLGYMSPMMASIKDFMKGFTYNNQYFKYDFIQFLVLDGDPTWYYYKEEFPFIKTRDPNFKSKS